MGEIALGAPTRGKTITMMKKSLAFAATLAALAWSDQAFAQEKEDSLIPGGFSGSVGLFSDYRFRGISQTDKDASLQGSLEYAVDSGILGITPYAGFWGSNVDFNDGDEAHVEVDFLFGLRGPIGDTGLSYDIGGIYYAYPGADKVGGDHLNYDYWEAAFGLGFEPLDMVAFNAGYYYSPDFFGSTGKAHYFTGGVTVTPPIEIHKDIGFSVFGNVGRQLVEDTKDYTDWNLGVGMSYKALEFTVSYVDTDLTQADLGGTALASSGLVFGLNASFEF